MKHILKREASNLDQDFIETMISELTNESLIENRRTPQGLVSILRVLSNQIMRKSIVVPYIEDVVIFLPSHQNRQCLQ